jgi:hypothetical protein
MQNPPCQSDAVYHAAHVLGIGEIIEFDIRLVVSTGAAKAELAAGARALERRNASNFGGVLGSTGNPAIIQSTIDWSHSCMSLKSFEPSRCSAEQQSDDCDQYLPTGG